MNLDDVYYRLANPFNPKHVKWRVGSTFEHDGQKCTRPLCYVDARLVMERLDDVVGPHNWQDNFVETPKRIICHLGIRHEDEWIWKSDGAGDTNMEGEKGGLSDAFKRAAVKFGIGRYLYSIKVKTPVPLAKGKHLPYDWASTEGIRFLSMVEPHVWKSKQMKTKYYNGLKSAAADNDAGGVRELWDEMDSDQQKDIWRDLGESSGVRSTIKSLLESTGA